MIEKIKWLLSPDAEAEEQDEDAPPVTIDQIFRDEVESRIRGFLGNAEIESAGDMFVAKLVEPELQATGMSRGRALLNLTVMLKEYFE